MAKADILANRLANLTIRVTLSGMKSNTDGTLSGGMVRNKGEGRPPRVDNPRPQKLARPDPITAQETAIELEGTKQYPNIKSPLKERRCKLACLGIPSHILDAGSQEYARTVRLANSYKKVRVKELFQAHGYVSSGVSALLAAASLALSGSRFLYEIAASTPIQAAERGDLTLPAILKMASSLSDSSRQNELSAWELCAREAIVRKRNDMNVISVPWIQSESGGERKKPGRKSKLQLLEENLPDARADAEVVDPETEGSGA